MAYKPKYAQTKPATPKPERHREIPSKKPRKMGRGMLIVFLILGIVIVPLSSAMTVRFMSDIWQNVGRPKQASLAAVPDM